MQHCNRNRRFILGLLSLGVLAGAALVSSPVQAASSNGPYYATPSWDQKLPAATRFIVLTDWSSQAVLDRETGLVWERTPLSTFFSGEVQTTDWAQAFHTCYGSAIVTGGRRGWRLPTAEELASLLSPFEPVNLKLPADHPFTQVLPARYWAATTYPGVDTTFAYFVDFGTANVGVSVKNTQYAVWCVRGGHGYDGR